MVHRLLAVGASVERHQVRDEHGLATTRGGVFRSGRQLWAICIMLIVVTLFGCGMTIWDLHRQTIEQQRVAVQNLGVVLAEQTARYMQVVDLVLEGIKARVAGLGIRTPEE